MSKLTKTQLLSNPEIAQLYQQYMMKQAGSGRGRKIKGAGIFDGFVKFLKDSKILSKVGDVLLPALGGLTAGLLTANPLGIAAGAAAGSAGSEFLKSKGFGHVKGHGHMKGHMKGGLSGASTLSISPNGMRLGQRGNGMTIAYNGTMQQIPGTQKGYGHMMGCGGTEFGSVYSEFGKIRV
jgi:hypothetical protein